jgi:hypothetical protein
MIMRFRKDRLDSPLRLLEYSKMKEITLHLKYNDSQQVYYLFKYSLHQNYT